MSAQHPACCRRPTSKRLVAAGEIDTVIVAFCDMQGTAHRQAGVGATVRRGRRRARRRVLQLPAGRRRRYEHRRRVRDVELGNRLRRHGHDAGFLDAAAPAVAAGYGAGDGGPVVGGRQTGDGRRRAASSTARSTGWPSAAWCPTSGPSSSSWFSTTPIAKPGPRATADLTPATDYNIDYAMLASTRMEPLLRDIRLGMTGAGMYCEGVKGECNLGQQEIAFRYDHARTTCDNHTIYKNGAKEIADQHGKSLTFMAKFDEREGNSCHIHISLRGEDGPARCSPTQTQRIGMSPMFRSFIAGQLATLRELTLFYAPNINSYKRFVTGQLRADGDRMGNGQPDVCTSGRRARPRHAGGMSRARRRRQPVSRGLGADRRWPARYRAGARAAGGVGGQRLYQRRRMPSDHTGARPRRCSTSPRSRVRRSATTSSSTTSTTRVSSSPRSTRR